MGRISKAVWPDEKIQKLDGVQHALPRLPGELRKFSH
jgi:hypothetical protein